MSTPEPLAQAEHLDVTATVVLRRPVMICAFEGWNDAGDAATTAANYVRARWDATPIASIDPEEFYDFSTTRPRVELDDDGDRHVVWPENQVWAAAVPELARDVLVVIGNEPQLKWSTFCRQITCLADHLDVSLLITVGALLSEVPHSRPVPIYGTSDDVALATELELQPSTYEGPTGIVGVLNSACRSVGVPTASLWAAVPTYVPGATSPKAALGLVERLATVLGTSFVTTDLEIASSAYERQISELVQEDGGTLDYVSDLERQYDDDALQPFASDSLVEEVERYLREQ